MWPVLFDIGDSPLPTYFAVWSLTACLIMYWAFKRAERHLLSPRLGVDLVLVVLVCGIVGARLFHVFFEYPGLYRDDPVRIMRFWEGGFVFYGGFLGGVIGGLGFLKWKRQNLGPWLDFAAPLSAFSYIMGRVGCFLTGCCYGRFCRLPWAVKFPVGVEAPAGMPVHPTQLYAVLAESITLGVLLLIESRPTLRSRVTSKPGDLFYLWIMLHGVGRIVMETYRADYRGQPFWGLSISTLISLSLVIVGSALYLQSSNKRASQS